MENKIKTVTAQYRKENWTNIISERNASGLSVKEWCQNNNIKVNAYYYWLRKIRHSIIETYTQQNEKKEDITFVPMLSNSLISNEGSGKNNSAMPTVQPEVIIRAGEIAVEFVNQSSQDLIIRVLQVLKDV